MVRIVDDDERPAPDARNPETAGGDAGADLLEEQRARIAALRFAVLSGRVPDEEAFDYARFFGGAADGGAAGEAPHEAPGDAPDDPPKG